MDKLPFETFERKVVVREEAETDPKLGCAQDKRTTPELIQYGVVNIDKPKGPTSHQVSDFVQKILHIKKAGHSGTLDPAVTGVLAVALGNGTRVVQALLGAGKEYVCVMHVHEQIDEEKIREVCASFVGKIDQLPPIKSSVKRQLRQRTVYYITIHEIKDQDVLFTVGCEAGTYIRKLCHDIGVKLGCGAHMAELRRTQAGPFKENTIITLQDLTDAYHYYSEKQDDSKLRTCIQSVESAVAHLPKVWVFDTTISSLCNGIDLKVPGISKLHDNIKIGEMVAVMSLKDELVALGTAKMESKNMCKDKGVAVQTDKVFMPPEVYKSASTQETKEKT